MTIKGWICNLGKYNEGYLVGEWIEFPIDKEELKAVYKRIGIGASDECGGVYEEVFFADWDCSCNLGFGEYTSIKEVNEIAERLDELDVVDDIAEAIIDYCNDLNEALDILERERYMKWPGCEDMTDVARKHIKEYYDLDTIPETFAEYFDYEAYGRTLETCGTFIAYENGYLEITY